MNTSVEVAGLPCSMIQTNYATGSTTQFKHDDDDDDDDDDDEHY